MFIHSGGATNEKIWDIAINSTTLFFRLLNDSYGSAATWMSVTRTGFASPVIAINGVTNFGSNADAAAAGTGSITTPGGIYAAKRIVTKNVEIPPAALTYGASVALDFTAAGIQTITLTGDITFTTSNLAAGRSVTLIITPGASVRAFTFPAWISVGAALPANVAANKTAILTLTATGTTDASVVAAYSVQP